LANSANWASVQTKLTNYVINDLTVNLIIGGFTLSCPKRKHPDRRDRKLAGYGLLAPIARCRHPDDDYAGGQLWRVCLRTSPATVDPFFRLAIRLFSAAIL